MSAVLVLFRDGVKVAEYPTDPDFLKKARPHAFVPRDISVAMNEGAARWYCCGQIELLRRETA